MRCALYMRVSSEKQANLGDSLEAQEATLEQYCKDNNLIIADKYVDAGISGQKLQRDELQRLFDDIKAGKIDMVLFTKLDRWFRNVSSYVKTNEFLAKYNVSWKAVLEGQYSTNSAASEAMANIAMVFSQLEAKQAGERVQLVFDTKIKNKEPITGTQPLGYKIEKVDGVKRIVKDPETQAEVEEMFEVFFSTLSGYATAKHMNMKYGRVLADNTYTRRLKNPAYTGEYRGVADYYPPYITHEQHLLILNTLSKNTRKAKKNKIYLFSGMLLCPECGHVMNSCTSNKKTLGYRCKYHFVQNCEYKHMVKEKDVEQFLLDNLKDSIKRYALEMSAEKQKIKKATPKKYEEQLSRLNNVYIMGNISTEEYNKTSAEIKAKIASLKGENTEITPIPQDVLNLLSDKEFPTLYDALSREDKQTLWRSVIDKISISGIMPTDIHFIK